MRFASLILIGALAFVVSCSDDVGNVGPDDVANFSPETVAPAAATVINEVVVNESFGLLDFMPCANGGAGEFVQFTGVFGGPIHVTINRNRFVFVLMGHIKLRGEGLSTGDKYEFASTTREIVSESLVNGQFMHRLVFNTEIIGPGQGNHLFAPLMFIVTVNANGEVTAELEKFSVECK